MDKYKDIVYEIMVLTVLIAVIIMTVYMVLNAFGGEIFKTISDDLIRNI